MRKSETGVYLPNKTTKPNIMTPITKELIFCRIEKLQSEKKSIQDSIDHIIERKDMDSMEFIEMWQIDIEMMDLQIEALKKLLFHS